MKSAMKKVDHSKEENDSKKNKKVILKSEKSSSCSSLSSSKSEEVSDDEANDEESVKHESKITESNLKSVTNEAEISKPIESKFNSKHLKSDELDKRSSGLIETPVKNKTNDNNADSNGKDSNSTPTPIVIPRKGISDRLAALKRNGEDGWKQRVKKDDIEPEVLLRVSSSANRRPTSITDRLSMLEVSSSKWKDRVEEKDAVQFTVAGKMGQTDKVIQPIMVRTPEMQRRTPKAKSFHCSNTGDIESLLSKSKANDSTTLNVEKSKSQKEKNNVSSLPSTPNAQQAVRVHKPDDDSFNAFFSPTSPSKSASTSNKIADQDSNVTDDAFDEVSIQLENNPL
jgi:hypothetical protein